MSIHHGILSKQLFGYRFLPDGAASPVKVGKSELSPELRLALGPGRAERSTWAVLDGDLRVRELGTRLMDLSDEAVFSDSARLVDLVRKARGPVGDTGIFEEILFDERIDERGRLALLGRQGSAERLARCAAAIPSSLYAGVRLALGLDEAWRDIEEDLPEYLVGISEAVLDVEVLAELREERSRLILAREEEHRAEEARRRQAEAERKRAEEEERKRKEEERLRLEAEEREKKRIQAEREKAFRKALEEARSPTDMSAIEVNEAFLEVFERVERGDRFLFVTGKPGTGKTTLIKALRERLGSTSVTVLAFTGMAAVAVGGQTINSFFQFPFTVLPPGHATSTWAFKRKALAMEVLVIDEASMLRPDMLDAIDSSLRAARKDGRPFGGVRVVLVGDLYQLPPVVERDNAVVEYLKGLYGEGRFFFASKVASDCPPRMVELDRVYRQRDREFLDFLHAVRDDSISGEALDAFNARIKALPPFGPSDFHVTVSPHNETADAHNERMLESLPGGAAHYFAVMSGKTEKFDRHSPAPKDLAIKRGAQVMILKNDKGKRWMNGDIGMVEELGESSIKVRCRQGLYDIGPEAWTVLEYDLDKETNRLSSREVASFAQFPLKLAWAATIHKMQGQTVERISIDLGAGVFDTGMTYVALSRCRTMEGIRLNRPLAKADLAVDETVADYLESLREAGLRAKGRSR